MAMKSLPEMGTARQEGMEVVGRLQRGTREDGIPSVVSLLVTARSSKDRGLS